MSRETFVIVGGSTLAAATRYKLRMAALHDLTTYTAAPGRIAELVEAYAVQGDHVRLVGAWTCEFGDLNRLLVLQSQPPDAEVTPDFHHEVLRAVERRRLRLARPLQLDGPAGVVEFRTYSIRPGDLQTYLGRMLAALPFRERYSRNIGVWTPMDGDVDQVLHLWGYADISDRMRARTGAFADEDWRRYIATIYSLMRRMNSQILLPTRFSPLK